MAFTTDIGFEKFTTVQRDALQAPSVGRMIFNTDTKQFNVWSGTAWVKIIDSVALSDISTSNVTATGAFTARTEADHWAGGFLSVKDFGAKGDGTTDDALAFNSAFSSGKRIYIPQGTYNIGSTITVNSVDLCVHGAGMGMAVLNLTSFSSGIIFNGNTTTKNHCMLRDFSIGRSNANSYGGTIGPKTIFIDYASISRVQNVEEYGAIGFGLQHDHSDDVLVEGCYVHDHKGGSVHLSGTDGIHFYRCGGPVRAIGNRVTGVGDDSISLGSFDGLLPTKDFVVANNVINDSASGIKLYGNLYDGVVSGNHIRNILSSGGIIAAANEEAAQSFDKHDILVVGNKLRNCGGAGAGAAGGIYFGAQAGTTGVMQYYNISILANEVESCVYGITVQSVVAAKRFHDIFIKGNTIRNTVVGAGGQGRGIFVDGTTGQNAGYGLVVIGENNVVGVDAEGILVQNFDTTVPCEIICKNNYVSTYGKGAASTYRGIWLRTPSLNVRYVCVGNRVFGGNNTPTALVRALEIGATAHPLSMIEGNTVDQVTTSGWLYPTSGYRAAVYAPVGSIPTSGTWQKGDQVPNSAVVAAGSPGWVCTTAGTFSTLTGVTGSITTATTTLTVNDASNLQVGMYINIVGVTGPKRVFAVSGTTVTVDSAADATVTGAAVSYQTPTFKALAAVAA